MTMIQPENSINTVKTIHKDWLSILLLLLITCIAHWPLAFHMFSLKNDALNYFLPVRHQVSEAISSGHYPFWSPYFNLGYALHGDMQSGVWNPIVQFFSLFGPYTLYTLQLETLLYIFLSGSGMYLLLRRCSMQIKPALFAAIAYMLCGFNSDCCQYLNWISGAAFLPYIVLFFYKTLQERNITSSLAAGFFIYLMFVTAYPAHFIVTLYLLAAILIWQLVLQFRAGSRSLMSTLSTFFLRLMPALICFLILSTPAILSYAQYLQLSERGNGTTYEDAMSNALHPLLLTAYYTPLPIHHLPYVDITDSLERNSYFGIITFSFALISFFIKTTSPWIRFSRIAFVVFQVLSFGQFGGLRPLTYYLLPLMNTFRHPAGMKIFTIFFGCIIAAWSLQTLIDQPRHRPKIKKALLFNVGLLTILFIISLSSAPRILEKINALKSARSPSLLKNWMGTLQWQEILLADSMLQLSFLILLILLLLRRWNYKAILTLNILNCILYTIFFAPFTVVKKDPAASIQQILDQNIVRGYPLPSLTTSLAANSADDSSRFDAIGCLNMYNKLPGRNGYRISPCNLLTQNAFWSDIAFRKTIMGYPLLYSPDTIVAYDGWKAARTARPSWKIGVVDASPTGITAGHPAADTGRMSVTAFDPDYFRFFGTLERPAFYILLQNAYPLWKLYIDGKRSPVILSDITFMGFQVPAGRHTIELRYHPLHIILSYWLSLGFTLFLLSFFIYRIRYIFP